VLSDLARTPISETLRRLSADRQTGELQVRSGKFVKTVFFDGGRLVFAASNLKKDRLGEALIAIGRITSHDFDRASTLMRERRQRFGDALVQAGVMEKDELGISVAKQVRRIVLSLFQLTEGAAFFEERECVIPLEYMVSISVHQALYQGIRTMVNPQLILAGIGDLDRRVTLAEVPPFRFPVQRCSAEEREVLEATAAGKVTLRKVTVAPGKLAMPRVRAAYALLASGILALVDAGSDTQPVVQAENEAFLLSPLRRDPEPSADEVLRREIAQELQRSADIDPKDWLKLPQGASGGDLIRALESKLDRYLSLLDTVQDPKLRADIEVVLGRATIQLRQAQRGQTLPAKPPADEPAPQPDNDGLPEIDLESGTGKEAARAKAATSDGSPADEEGEPGGPASASGQPPTEEQLSGTGRMTGIARVEHMLMEAEVRMTVGDYANAIKVYDRLVEQAPDVAAYRVKLAIAMTHHPRTVKRAEREFVEATRLEPGNPDIHYQLGLYYKIMKQKSRAIAAFRTAIRLAPRHRPAREELEALSPRDSALTSLRKLFK
jgi:tetratricopeptide (TPR) repeat protein